MKKTQLKDALKNIRKQKVSFISIIFIALLGVTSYIGIDFSAAGLLKNGSEIYREYNFRDIEIVSTLMLTPDDVDAIRAVEGVKDVETVRYAEAKASAGDARLSVNVITSTERINLVRILDGRMPENANECAIEKHVADGMELSVGDTVSLSGSGSTAKSFPGGDFSVVGVVNHPDHLNDSVPEPFYAIVTWDAFSGEQLQDTFMKAEVIVEKDEAIFRFSDGYKDTVGKVTERIEALAPSREEIRNRDVLEVSAQAINDGEIQLAEAKEKLEDARRKLDEGKTELEKREAELEAGEKQLAEAKPQITDGEKQLADARAQLDDARAQLDAGKAELDAGKAELDAAESQFASAKTQLEESFSQLEDGKEQIRSVVRDAFEAAFKGGGANLVEWAHRQTPDVDDPSVTAKYLYITDNVRFDLSRSIDEVVRDILDSGIISDDMLVPLYEMTMLKDAPKTGDEYDLDAVRAELVGYAKSESGQLTLLTEGVNKWDEGHAEYVSALDAYNEGLAEYGNGAEKLAIGEEQYREGLAEYERGLAEFTEKKAEYEKAAADLEAGRAKLEEGRIELEDGELQYAEGLSEYEEGVAELEKNRAEFNKLSKCKWICTDADGNSGYIQTKLGNESVDSMKVTFSMMFVIVAGLVIFATVGKMVDEQRTQIGTPKALGFFMREIFAKYLIFGVSAALIGTVLGIVVARFLVEPFLLGVLTEYFCFDLTKSFFFAVPVVIAVAAAIVLSVSAVALSCVRLLREPAIRLMQPKAPGVRKKTGGGSKLSLYSRLILLNMRMDLKRVIVTIVSVAGCCALIVVGLTLKIAVSKPPDIQFGGIVKYDFSVKYDPSTEPNAGKEIKALLDKEGTDYTGVYSETVFYRVTDLEFAELFCGDINEIERFYELRNPDTKKMLYATNEGVLVGKRVAEEYRLDLGDEMELSIGGTKTATVRMGGFFENYIGSAFVMSRGYYEAVYGGTPEDNAFLVTLNGADAEELTEKLGRIEGVSSITRSDSGRTIFETAMSAVDSIVVLFIFIAGVMAGVVLLNLTNMYILQKKRELTIMRVNGFSVKEVIGYVLRETVVTTILGIILGFGMGSAVEYLIVRKLEQPVIGLFRGVSPLSWLIAAALTVVFTAIVNLIALRPVKNLKLTDVA